MELYLKWLYLFNRAFALIIPQNGYQNIFVASSNRWWHDPTPWKHPIPTLNCWTQLASSIWIRHKQSSLQNTEIWTLVNLLRVIIRICINTVLLILSLFFYVTIKNKTIRKSNTDIAMFEIILEFEKKYDKMCWHSITLICLLMAYRYICVMCFILNTPVFNERNF